MDERLNLISVGRKVGTKGQTADTGWKRPPQRAGALEAQCSGERRAREGGWRITNVPTPTGVDGITHQANGEQGKKSSAPQTFLELQDVNVIK